MNGEARTCPECLLTVAADFRFCPSCGIPLEQPVASAPVAFAPVATTDVDSGASGARHPSASPVQREAPRWVAERRLVSVLFVDLVGFTRLSEQLDAEDVREIQSRYFEAARAAVARYGGSLEKFIGDAVMAVWGTPVAQENDAERAVRAGLEVVHNVASIATSATGRLEARAAVTTGEAAVTLDIDGEGMVTGDLVNTASRLQEAAAPGTLLADDATRRAVAQAIRFEAAGPQTLKGKAAAVSAWRVVEPSTSTGGESRAGHAGPFVGRAKELGTLEGLVESVLEEHRMMVVSIVGVAGIGKSRLVWELERSSRVRGGVRWFTGRPPRWGQGTPFAPLSEMLHRSVGVAEGEPSEVVRRAVDEALNRLIPDVSERAWIEPRLMALIEPSESARVADDDREQLFAAWRRYLEAEADVEPIALVFEDLHWADGALIDFLDYLASWSRRRRIVIVVLARPELLETRPTWGAGMHQFTSMHLDGLGAHDIDMLLGALAAELPQSSTVRIRQRAEGVPLYAVEIARMLTERAGPAVPQAPSAGPVAIPESLHALLAARIDALPPNERSLVLSAAVLGRRFRPEALLALSGVDRPTLGRQVGALVRRELLAIDDEPGSPGRGQISFVQDLVREVAYNTLSRRERRARHLAVIDYLQSTEDPDRIEPMAEHLVAAHAAIRADQPEAGPIADRAREALRLAADRAKALHAPQRALAHLVQALALTSEPVQRADLLEAAASAGRAAASFSAAEEHLREAIDIRDSIGDTASSTRHRRQLASLLLQAQRSETALAELESAWESARRSNDDSSVAHLPAELARAHLLRGETEQAIEWAQRALAASDVDTDPGGRALAIDARATLGSALTVSGKTAEGLAELRRAIADAAEAGTATVELRARNNLAWLTMDDDPRATSDIARRGLEVAERLGNREWTLHLSDVATVAAIEIGDWEWALEALDSAAGGELPTAYRLDFAATRVIVNALRGEPEALSPIHELGPLEPDLDPLALGWVDVARALVSALAGDLPQALDLARVAANRTVGWERAEALALAGRVAAWNGDLKAASTALKELEADGSWGRAAAARIRTLRAAVQALRSPSGAIRRAATQSWEVALKEWGELRLPLREGLCRLDRWRLASDEAERVAAARIFDRLGARALAAYVKDREPKGRVAISAGRGR